MKQIDSEIGEKCQHCYGGRTADDKHCEHCNGTGQIIGRPSVASGPGSDGPGGDTGS